MAARRIVGAVRVPGATYRAGQEDALAEAAKEHGFDLSDARFSGALSGDWGGGAGGFDVEAATKEELQAEAERRGVTVTRSDGKEGEPRVSDYRAALK